MEYPGNTELLEWELDMNDAVEDDALPFEDEGRNWVSGSQRRDSDDNPSPEPRSVPQDWRQRREMLSPLEGAQKEAELEAQEGSTETKDERIQMEQLSRGSSLSDENSPSSHNHSGGDQFQPMEDKFDEDTYYYDEDLTRNRNSTSEPHERTQSDADLIFRGPSDSPTRHLTILRYLVVAALSFTLGIALGFLISKASSYIPDPTTTVPTSIAATTIDVTTSSVSSRVGPMGNNTT